MDKHLSKHLAALIDGELDPDARAQANAHLAACTECRAARERYDFAAAMMRQIRLVVAPESIWTAIDVEVRRAGWAGRSAAAAPAWDRALKSSLSIQVFERRWRAALALAAVLVIAVGSVVFWQARRAERPWDVVRLDAPAGAAKLALGEWIETTATSTARIRIGGIGMVDVAPRTRMQLLVARANEHRLNLARGSISAQIVAPPRLFFVETAASTVVDLGCAYTMAVDEAGVGLLRVTSGWASLEWDGRESLVPAGASCPTRPGIGPGTPSFDDAPELLRQALLAFDFAAAGSSAVDVVLREARERDTLTLWHLLSRVDLRDRARVVDRMETLTPLPAGVTRDKALALDAATLTRWREELAWTW
jgi:anti-sigma factor RsiW